MVSMEYEKNYEKKNVSIFSSNISGGFTRRGDGPAVGDIRVGRRHVLRIRQ